MMIDNCVLSDRVENYFTKLFAFSVGLFSPRVIHHQNRLPRISVHRYESFAALWALTCSACSTLTIVAERSPNVEGIGRRGMSSMSEGSEFELRRRRRGCRRVVTLKEFIIHGIRSSCVEKAETLVAANLRYMATNDAYSLFLPHVFVDVRKICLISSFIE